MLFASKNLRVNCKPAQVLRDKQISLALFNVDAAPADWNRLGIIW